MNPVIHKKRKTLHRVVALGFGRYKITACGLGFGEVYKNEDTYETVTVNPLVYSGPLCKVCFK